MNVKTPAGANGEGSGKASDLQADAFHLALPALQIQTRRLRQRFGIPAATAAALAELAFPSVESWRARL